LFMRVLSRAPSSEERATLVELLAPGFEKRINASARVSPARPPSTLRAVTWSNHLHADATKVKLALEEAARAGDPPTPRLETGWRERAEDAIWALMLSPEFVFVP